MHTRSLSACAAVAGLLLLGACSGGTKAGDSAANTVDAAPAAPAAAKMPKAGLWELKTTSAGVAVPAMKVCVGETKPGDNPFVSKQPGANCAKNNVTSNASGYDIDLECTQNGMTVATKGSVTGDMSSAYKVEMATSMKGANLPPAAQKETKVVIEAKYQGACPADMQPKTAG
ncbi:DUF3617 domain-containing protein [Sphingomonas sp.]|uniref:DUF3617 domain-containing protein n=1 Tax=Sphingomonas sp. TaxID=28214 RepID=UPI003D6D5242